MNNLPIDNQRIDDEKYMTDVVFDDETHSIEKCGIDTFPFSAINGELFIDTENCSRIVDCFLPVNYCPTCGKKIK